MVVAVIALFVAMGGVGYAGAKIGSAQVKDNSLRGKDIRNATITGKDVRNGGIAGADVKNSSLAGRDVKSDSLTGDDILESTLGQVPSAKSADSATTARTATTATTADKVNANGVDTTALQNSSVTSVKLGPRFVELSQATALADDNTMSTADGQTATVEKSCTGINAIAYGGGVLMSDAGNPTTPAKAAQVHIVNTGSTGSGWKTQVWQNTGQTLTLKEFVYCLR